MEHGRRRHLGAEFEAARGFRAVNLDRLTIVPRDGLDHFEDVRENGAHKAACPRPDEDAAGKTLDFALAGEARKRPVDGAARAVLQKALARERLSLRQLAYAGSNGSYGGHVMPLLVRNSSCVSDTIKSRCGVLVVGLSVPWRERPSFAFSPSHSRSHPDDGQCNRRR